MHVCRIGILLLLSVASPHASVLFAESAHATVTVSAVIGGRTSLRVSHQTQLQPEGSGGAPSAVVEFTAGARTRAGAEVVLSVERLGDRPAGAESVRFTGQGEGTSDGVLAAQPAVVARWTGSGLRRGRMVFAMPARDAGTAAACLRFVLTVP